MKSWQCVQNCGACCYLAPAERPFLAEYLSAELLALYHSLVGADGWCIHFQKTTRRCGIYANRPAFCRVSPQVLQDLYGEDPDDLTEWAIHCCREHIDSVWGAASLERQRFEQQLSGEPADIDGGMA
ncbi:YkgJ family cysteine cluster protein [Gloeobacter kilaueensis]|uniref:Fe-S-cluster oxidoreductase n=1 Tax=Gloeobacter kilaueensis (strain ATCC BAA-2537 / CCAP 1431/1 / ULC 316 / JS1) TaxID=1183438 RepID=U5QLM4_GLOK1|nr:YkgJ family cysteine cluster protein [Gloeobacter kilaueensis]AGY58585.1 Fe-S-cluster oxidoreductase [Gloeobacter kilaueensis JS1]